MSWEMREIVGSDDCDGYEYGEVCSNPATKECTNCGREMCDDCADEHSCYDESYGDEEEDDESEDD